MFLQLYTKFVGVKLPLFARERILCRKPESLSRAKVFFRGDDVRVEKMGRGIEKTEAANAKPTFAASALGLYASFSEP